MFKENTNHKQIKLISFLTNLPKSVTNTIDSSWAKPFYLHVFNKIDENKFKPMYSKKGSRPNKAANVLVGLEVIKQLFDYTDEELIESFHTDLRVMYALGITEPGEITMAIRTIYYFRKRLVEHDQKNNSSLVKEVLKDISLDLSNGFGLELKIQRMDSSMVEANIKRLTRLNLFVKVIYNFLKLFEETDIDSFPIELQDLYKSKNLDLSYRLKKKESEEMLLKFCELTYFLYQKYKDNQLYNITQAFKNIKRLVDEQMNITGGDTPKVDLKKDDEISSSSLQNPSDPDASYHFKKAYHKGYVANFAETCSKNNAFQVITDVEVRPNNISDIELLSDSLKDKNSLVSEADDLLTDGGYLGKETEKDCNKSNVNLHVSAIRGPKISKKNQNLADAVIENNILKECPAGKKPYEQKYNEEKKYFSGRFKKEDCANCPLRSECFVKENKKFFSYHFKAREYYIKKLKKKFEDPDYRKFMNLRAGAESMVYMMFFKRGKRTRFRRILRVKNAIVCRAIGVNLLRLISYMKNDKVLENLASVYFLFFTKYHQYLSNLRKKILNLKTNFQNLVFLPKLAIKTLF